MGKIKKFKLYWGDAWGIITEGYDSTIEITEDGKTILQFLADMKPVSINIGDKEDMFIHAIKKTDIEKLRGYKYDYVDMLDGDEWSLDIIADDLDVYASGHCVFPYEFERLLEYLHKEWHLPICRWARQYYHKHLDKYERYGKRSELDEEWRMYFR